MTELAYAKRSEKSIKLFKGEKRACYEIPLDRCQNAEQVLNWIFQVAGKSWATPELMKDFIDLLRVSVSFEW